MNRRMTEEQAKKTFERALKMEHEFGEYFTGNKLQNTKLIVPKNCPVFDSIFSCYPRRHHRGDIQ